MDLDLTDEQIEAIRILEAIGATVILNEATNESLSVFCVEANITSNGLAYALLAIKNN